MLEHLFLMDGELVAPVVADTGVRQRRAETFESPNARRGQLLKRCGRLSRGQRNELADYRELQRWDLDWGNALGEDTGGFDQSSLCEGWVELERGFQGAVEAV